MKASVVGIFIIVLGLIGGGVMKLNHAGQSQMMSIRQEISNNVAFHLLGIQGAEIVERDCRVFEGKTVIEGTRCFLSPMEPEALLPMIQKAMENIGKTGGWSEDYAIWGAFYSAKIHPRRTFGINLGAIEGNRDLEGIKEAVGFKSYISFVVNSTDSP